MPTLYKTEFSIAAIGSIARDSSISSATTIAIPANATGVLIQADTGDVRFTFDGTEPTSTLGLVLIDGAPATRLDLFPGAEIKVLSASGAVNYQFYRAQDSNGLF